MANGDEFLKKFILKDIAFDSFTAKGSKEKREQKISG